MCFHSKTSLFSVALAGLAVSLPLHAVVIQDFEVDTSGIAPISSGSTEDSNSVTSILKRTDGTDTSGVDGDFLPGVSSSGGSFHAEVRTSYENNDGDFFYINGERATWNTGTQTGGFQSGFGHSADIFLDDLGFYDLGDKFFVQNTLLDDTNSTPVDGGGFGIAVVETTDSGDLAWRIGADGDTKGFSGVTGSTFDVATSGWVTMETLWVEDGSGNVDQVNNLYDSSGSIVFTSTLEDRLSAADAGAVGAASLGNGDEADPSSLISAIGVDNVTVVPEPSAYALLFGSFALALGLLRRRR